MKKSKLDKSKSTQGSSGLSIITREFIKDPAAIIALVVLTVAILFITIIPLVVDEASLTIATDSWLRLNQPPCDTYILGTDDAGRDVFALLAIGARSSLLIALMVTLMSGFVGISLGLISGYFGGRFDNIVMRIIDFVSTLPALVMIIAIIAIFPGFSIVRFSSIMAFFLWPGIARMVRARAIQEKELEYIQASKTLGTSHFKTIFRELLPNISSIIIVNMTLSTAANIGLETGLSFLGFGFPFEYPSLGRLISEASSPIVLQHRWWIWLPAALFVLVLMLAINTIGRTLNRATDARLRRG